MLRPTFGPPLMPPLGCVLTALIVQEHGADVNATDSPASPGVLRTAGGGGGGGCRTALHHAAEAGSFAVVQLLLHHGAFVGVRDNAGGYGRRTASSCCALAFLVASVLMGAQDPRWSWGQHVLLLSLTALSRIVPCRAMYVLL